MRTAFIVNPAAGAAGHRSRAGGSRVEIAARHARAAGGDVDVVATTHRGHARELAASCVERGVDRVVVWGGDGTINEAAGPLIRSRVTLGIIPGGSGDGLVHSLGLPRTVDAAMQAALFGPSRPVDVGWLGSRHFLNIGGIGFDAEVAVRFNRRTRRGTRGYIVDGLQAVWNYRCAAYEVEAGGERWTGRRFLVAFANGREYGNGLVLVPTADPTDGSLDLVLVADGGPLQQCWRARRLAVRRMAPAEGLVRRRLTSARVTGDRLMCHVDGETFEASGSLDVSVDAGAIRVAGAGG